MGICGRISFTKKGFNSVAKHFGCEKNKAAWDVIGQNASSSMSGAYIEGLDKLGNDIIMKKKIKEKQIDKRNDFIPYGRPDIWASTLHISQSLRTKKMDDLLGADPVYDHFSSNNYLPYYKKALISSGNVDHIVPFKHSLDKRGLPMDRLRPDVRMKIYPGTAGEQLTRKFYESGLGGPNQRAYRNKSVEFGLTDQQRMSRTAEEDVFNDIKSRRNVKQFLA